MLKIRKVVYEPVDIDRARLMTVKETAELLGMTLPGVVRAVERGALTEIIDEEKPYHGRRLLLRAEVEELAKR